MNSQIRNMTVSSNRDLEEIFSLVKDAGKIYFTPKIKRIISCNKWNIVITEKNHTGMAFNFTGEHNIYNISVDEEKVKSYSKFIKKPVDEFFCHLSKLSGIHERSFMLACINAVSQEIISERMEDKSLKNLVDDDLDFVKQDDNVTIVGYGALIDKLQGRCKNLTVVDKRDKICLQSIFVDDIVKMQPSDIKFEDDIFGKDILKNTDVLILTGSVLVNGSYIEILKKAKNTVKTIGIFGPSAQMLPEILQDMGFSYITSNNIKDADKFCENIANPLNKKYENHEYNRRYSIFKKTDQEKKW